MKNIFKQINRVAMRLLLVLLICTIILVIVTRTSGEDGPALFGYQTFNVLSDSMNPYIKTGDMIITKNVAPSEIETDDVIAFHQDEKVITHRVIEIEKKEKDVSFKTKGDNNNIRDEEKVLSNDVIGKQIFNVPKGGYAAKFISSPIGLFIIVVIPFTGYLILELYERLKKVRNNEK